MQRETTEQESRIDLRGYLAILRRRRWALLGTLFAVLLTTALVTWRMTPLYKAVVRVEVQPVNLGSTEATRLLESMADPERFLTTQVELIKSGEVLSRATTELGLPNAVELAEGLDVELVADSQIMEISVVRERPAEASRWANVVAQSYVDSRLDRAEAQILASHEEISRKIEELRRRISELDSGVDTAQSPAEKRIERDTLVARMGALEAQRQALPDPSSARRGGGTIVAPAPVPEKPASPNKPLNLIVALFVGSLLGAGLALLAETLDDRLHSAEEVEKIAGAPVLGHVPLIENPNPIASLNIVTLNGSDSGAAEAYRTLQTNLRFLAMGQRLGTLVITSVV